MSKNKNISDILIKFKERTNTISEIYGANSPGFDFCLLNNNLEAIHPYLKCKDFFNDLFCALAIDQKFSIFGFGFDLTELDNYRKELEAMDKIKLGVRNRNDVGLTPFTEEVVNNMQLFLNTIEDKLSITNSSFVIDKEKNLLVMFGKEWTTTSEFVSIFFMLLRIAQNYKPNQPILEFISEYPKNYAGHDAGYIDIAKDYLISVLCNKIPYYTDYTTIKNVCNIHSCGFVSGANQYKSLQKQGKKIKNKTIQEIIEETRDNNRKYREKQDAKGSLATCVTEPIQ